LLHLNRYITLQTLMPAAISDCPLETAALFRAKIIPNPRLFLLKAQ
jgi:hypothetical protein